MTRQALSMNRTHHRYPPEFKGEALALANRIDATAAPAS